LPETSAPATTTLYCLTIAKDFARWGYDSLEQHYTLIPKGLGDPYVLYQRQLGCCFDDAGAKELRKNFGNETDMVDEILQSRYTEKIPFVFTYLTTNKTRGEFEATYGPQLASRSRQMFNFLKIGGEDQRR
jgi:hypothetical protein